MAIPAFPIAKCNYPVRDSFNSGYANTFKRTVMDDAHGRYRRQWAAQPVNQTLNWHLNWAQLEYFEAFLKYDCAQATGYFTMPLYPDGPTNTYRMTAYPEISFDDSNGFWQVAAKVEYVRAAPTGYNTRPATLPVWPISLPQPEKSSYDIKRDNTVTRTDLSSDGLAEQRARWTDEVGLFDVTWLLDESEYAIWDDFIHNQLLGGLCPFKGWFANGSGTVQTRIRFVDAPTVQSQGAAFAISAQCEIQQIPGMSYVDYLAGQLAPADTITFTDQITFKITRGALSDDIAFTDDIRFKIQRTLSDGLTYTESANIVHTGYTSTNDTIGMSEQISFRIKPAARTDSITLGATGYLIVPDYASDYVTLDYTGSIINFTN